MRLLTGILLIVVLANPSCVLAADIDGYHLSDGFTRSGAQFALAGCGLREFLFNDIYLLGLYLPKDNPDFSRIHDGEVSKVFRLEVLYEGNFPEDLPGIWREPLAEQVSSELLQILQENYDRVNSGDTVEFAYLAGQGEEIRINDELVIQEPGRELIPALLELWLGDDPVSGNLKRLLLNNNCQ